MVRRGLFGPERYVEQTGVAAPAEVVELWSVLGGRDIVGMDLESAHSAGQWVAARADEAEWAEPGEPFEELDGSSDGAVRMVWWDRRWCLLHVSFDFAIAVDMNPGAEGTVGQVIYCDMDFGADREALWGSVPEFLRDVLAVVCSDELRVVDGFGVMIGLDGSEMVVRTALAELGRARRDGRPVPLRGIG